MTGRERPKPVKYRFLDRLIIHLIMYITDGPIDPKTVAEARSTVLRLR